MVTGNCCTLTDEAIKANILRTISMVMVSIHGQMAMYMKEVGKMANNMARLH